ncbi:M64 family metallopeptidase [Amycolatopsis anabasis]|uniref:M64 family metallopeptidase n=1 Tax=Amycolatopsis anabasis TaxID=1840409 RepID=UPI00131E815F|nr:M64 family metallopeptidase [Amycolatopsis anabasis]
MLPRLRFLAALFAGLAFLALVSAPGAGAGRTEVREVFSPDGSISRIRVPVPDQPPAPETEVRADVVPIQQTGPSDKRFDLVFVGDGYTADQLATYHQHAVNRWNELIQIEPYKSLKDSFNVWQVNVVSPQSGVDNDPTQGVRKDTALDMYFWCGNTERLLCVNETKANQYARQAPGVDQVLALANSTKYGGAGGGVATSSGGNARSGQIVAHELGHSVGGLADEYDYPDDLYTGPEPSEVNVSTYTEDAMRDREAKWYRYLGKESPDGGVVGTYEGAYYHKRGVYRPTDNSLMRSLGRPFNLPSLDVMREAILRKTGESTGR